jgi:hypothetical protein
MAKLRRVANMRDEMILAQKAESAAAAGPTPLLAKPDVPAAMPSVETPSDVPAGE